MRYLLLLLLTFSMVAQAMEETLFQNLIRNLQHEEFEPVAKFLQDNKQQYAKDPEYYVVLLNYALIRGEQSKNTIGSGPAKEGDLVLTDPDTGKEVGFVGSRSFLGQDVELILSSIAETQQALQYFRDRLDIHFGIVRIASKIQRSDIMATQLVEVMHISNAIKHQWKWGPINSMEGEPREFMLNNVQGKVHDLFYQENQDSDAAIVKISEAMIKEFPEVIYGYASLGGFYLATKKYDLAEKYLRQAQRIDPNDDVVKANLETLHKRREKK